MESFKDSDERAARLERILEATKSLHSTLDLIHLTEIILQIIRQEVPVDRVTAFMVDRKTGVLRSVVAQGVKDFVIRIPLDCGIGGEVARTGKVIDIDDAYGDPRFFPEVDRLTGYHTRDIYAVPILNREEEIVGVLELLNRGRPINGQDAEFLNDIALHIGMALERAWSHREVLDRQILEQERRELRERLVQMDRLRVMAEMLGSVMHELNNPLAILIGNVELLRIKLGLNHEHRTSQYLERIEVAAERSSAAVQKFLKFVQAPRRERRALDVPGLLRQTVALREYDWELSGIRTEDHIDSVPPVSGNAEELQQVFLNILKNAEESILRAQREGWIRVTCTSRPDWVRVEITDSGDGIPAELQSRIFEPFFSTKGGMGTGLGLMIARRIIEEHGGKLWFSSVPGTGATFSMDLPTVEPSDN